MARFDGITDHVKLKDKLKSKVKAKPNSII